MNAARDALPSAGVEESRASVVRLMVPTDANFMGNVFGGSILAEIDRVAFVTAQRHARSTVVTASIDRVDFLQPVHVGDVVDFDARVTWVGRTSMEIWVRVTAEPASGGTRRHVGEAFVTMVAVDAAGHPVAVPPLALANDEERRRYEEGRLRAEARGRTRHRSNAPASR